MGNGVTTKPSKAQPISRMLFEEKIIIENADVAKTIYTFNYFTEHSESNVSEVTQDYEGLIGLNIKCRRILIEERDVIEITQSVLNSDEINSEIIDTITDSTMLPDGWHSVRGSHKPPPPLANNKYLIDHPCIKFKLSELVDKQELFNIYSLGNGDLDSGNDFEGTLSINLVLKTISMDKEAYLYVKTYD